MKQIKYLLLFAAILMANSTFAQSAAKAKECLDKATAIVSNQSGITARFTLSSPVWVAPAVPSLSKGLSLLPQHRKLRFGLTARRNGLT